MLCIYTTKQTLRINNGETMLDRDVLVCVSRDKLSLHNMYNPFSEDLFLPRVDYEVRFFP